MIYYNSIILLFFSTLRATLHVDTNKNLSSIQIDESAASQLTAKIKQLEKERMKAQQQVW